MIKIYEENLSQLILKLISTDNIIMPYHMTLITGFLNLKISSNLRDFQLFSYSFFCCCCSSLHSFFFFVVFFFLTKSCCVAQTDIKFSIYTSWSWTSNPSEPPKCWSIRFMLSCLVSHYFFKYTVDIVPFSI